jgi:hypothetical protein
MKDILLGLTKTPPHILWLNSTLAYLNKMTLANPKLRSFYDNVVSKGTIIGCEPRTEDEGSLLLGMNLIFTLNNAQEIAINGSVGLEDELLFLEEKNFNVPFEEMVFTTIRDDMYEDSFLQLFKMDEEYTDPTTKKISPVYILKRMVKQKSKVAALPSEFTAAIEVMIIPSKLPRLIFPSYVSDICRRCQDVNETRILDNLCDKPAPGVRYCLKSPNTMKRCSSSDGQEITYSEAGFMLTNAVTQFLMRINRSPKRIERIARIADEVRSQKKVNIVIPEQRSFIEIKDKRFFYREPSVSRNNPGTHASPCRHFRRETTRLLRSGKIIPVKSTIVNPDGKKPTYIIKGDNKNGESSI